MSAWIAISIAAAAFQTLRFMLQKQLSETRLSTAGVTFARFVYTAPVVAVAAVLMAWASGAPVPRPAPGGLFWLYVVAGGLAQVLATLCVIATFRQRNFAVGITLKKTETVQVALAGALVLGDRVTAPAMAAILLGLAGVLLLSDPPGGQGRWHRRIFNRAAGLGLLGGFFFAVSGVSYRGATLDLDSGTAFLRALVALGWVTALQTLGMSLWLAWREPGQITAVLANWRRAGLVGLTSMAGSACWFTAFALQNAAYVTAVGQIELIFAWAVSSRVFGERSTGRELAGIALLAGSILALILVT